MHYKHPKSIKFNPKYTTALEKLEKVTMEGSDKQDNHFSFANLPFSFDETVEDFEFVY